jgi:superfamily II DNA or RNA helicase
MELGEYFVEHEKQITQDSERLFVTDFLYPILGDNISQVVPQRQFIDRTGRRRSIDFAIDIGFPPMAFEIDGETYHAEGAITGEMFDDSLFRQNEIIAKGYRLARFSYSQLQSPVWRGLVMEEVKAAIRAHAPHLLNESLNEPNEIQEEALQALDFHRRLGLQKGVVVMPTGTGKTYLAALDSKRSGQRTLYVVHRLDILSQTVDTFKQVYGPDAALGFLTGTEKKDHLTADVVFASKDTLRQSDVLLGYEPDHFGYVVIDEVHHGESPSYRAIFEHFEPEFMLGMTATPDRTDRKDIFELFDYHKIYETDLTDAIERGLLVPYSYYGLTDDIDYSHIRFQNNRYRVDDLERALIIPERNEAILREYLDRGHGDKAVGFCVSVPHAERMAEFFQENNVSAVAIYSRHPDRERLVDEFRHDKYQVAFTVDLFNEGVDIPNLRVLLFLRPTESKTVFMQQLGRGLRLTAGKERVTILDFIGNYKRANQIRKYLAKSERREPGDGRARGQKSVYEYATGCEVIFDEAVEEILDRQDREAAGITREDLVAAYYDLVERLERKPSRNDIDQEGEYKTSQYVRIFGGWVAFLREIGELTEASFHYPQGTTLGHVLSIVWHFGLESRAGTLFDDDLIRLSGGFDAGQKGNYERQLKYKLQAAMELGLLTDSRRHPQGTPLELTELGHSLRKHLANFITDPQNFEFRPRSGQTYGTTMPLSEEEYDDLVLKMYTSDDEARKVLERVFLNMDAVQQMLQFLYQFVRQETVQRSFIYENFFEAPFVQQYCDRNGIEEASLEASRRRCPFLLHILRALGIVTWTNAREIVMKKMVLTPEMVKTTYKEPIAQAATRLEEFSRKWVDPEYVIDDADLSMGRELYGADFLTGNYYLNDFYAYTEVL